MRPVSAVFTAIPTVLGAGWRPLLVLSMTVWSTTALLTTATLLIALDVTRLNRTVLDFVDTLERAGDLAAIQAAWESAVAAAGAAIRWSVPTTTLLLALLAAALFLLSTLMITGSIRVAQRALGDGMPDHPPRTDDRISQQSPRPPRLGWGEGLREAFVRLPGVIGTCALVMPALALPWLLLGLWLPLTIWVVTTGSAVVLTAVVGAAGAALCLAVVTAGRLTPALPRAALSRGALRWSWRVTRGRFWAVLARIALWVLVLATVIQLVLGVVLAPMATVSSPEDATTWIAAALLWLLSVPGYVTVTGWYAVGLVPIAADLAAQEPAATDHPAGSHRQPDPSGHLSGPGNPPPSGSAAS